MTRVLGIESSCDESAVSLVEGEGDRLHIVKNIVSSQIEVHKQYGGVIPEVAARQHVQVLAKLLEEQGIKREEVDVIAVTSGPGLVTALRVGIDTAKALAWAWEKPLVGVNHIEGHIYANWLRVHGTPEEVPQFPALCLVVSGGHTELLLMREYGKYERLGETLDDAVGEAFDKVAKLLGLPYPGGPAVAKAAESGDPRRYRFPRPMMKDETLDLSYSGLKTAVRIAAQKELTSPDALPSLAASFQAAALEPLIAKTERALGMYREVKSLLLAGGVSANTRLRAMMAETAGKYDVPLFIPDLALTGDNAAMIAAAGFFRAQEASKGAWQTLRATSNWQLGAHRRVV